MLTFMRERYCTKSHDSSQWCAQNEKQSDRQSDRQSDKLSRLGRRKWQSRRVWWLIGLLLLGHLPDFAFAWEVDLSRRREERQVQELVTPIHAEAPENLFDQILTSREPLEDVVILNTEKGFVPSTIRLRKERRYVFYVVNVNANEKNVSFVMDAFAQHHSTYFGQTKSFMLEAKKEGIYSYLCPETGSQGRIVVFAGEQPVLMRRPAAQRQ